MSTHGQPVPRHFPINRFTSIGLDHYMDRTATPAPHVVSALNVSAIRLPAVDPELARLTRLVCDGRFEARLRQALDISDWRVSAIPAPFAEDACWIDLVCDGGRASIGLATADYPALAVAASTSGDDEASATAPLRCAVAALLLAPLFDAFERLGAGGVEVGALGRRAPDGPTLTLRFTHREQRCTFLLGHVATPWLDLVERQLGAHRLPFTQRMSEIRVPSYLVIGEKRLSIGTLNRLRPGDIVLRAAVPGLPVGCGPGAPLAGLELRFGPAGSHQYVARATLDDQQLVITEDPTMTYRNDRTDLPADAENGASIDELDLPVKFEVETVTLPLVQLSALRAGYVLELPGALRDARIRLVSYGQLIGMGELVTIGEQLGVRVLEMYGSHDAD